MTEFVKHAEEAVLSPEDAMAVGKPRGELFEQIEATKEGLDRLVSFFGAILTVVLHFNARARARVCVPTCAQTVPITLL